jgi:hypothetical protein
MSMHPHRDDILAGFIGFTLTALGTITSFQEQLLWGVQFTSGLGAIAVASLTVWKMAKKKN